MTHSLQCLTTLLQTVPSDSKTSSFVQIGFSKHPLNGIIYIA